MQDNLELMVLFLKKAFLGIDMKLISFWHPTHIYRSNSCPFGLGGYSHKGFAWRLELQEQYCFRASNNLLKFIASIITPWIDMTSKHLQLGDCVLSMMDSTMSAGWLKQTSFQKQMKIQSRQPSISKLHKNMPVFSFTTTSRNTLSGSLEKKTTLPMLPLKILTSATQN